MATREFAEVLAARHGDLAVEEVEFTSNFLLPGVETCLGGEFPLAPLLGGEFPLARVVGFPGMLLGMMARSSCCPFCGGAKLVLSVLWWSVD